MPELPEVETTRLGIEPHILGQIVSQVVVRQPQLRWTIPDDLAQRLLGHRIAAVKRRGKYLLLEIGGGNLLIHLGMSGSLRILPADTPASKHDHVDIQFQHGQLMRFHDPRRFGCMLWLEQSPFDHKLLHSLGPEPLEVEFNADYLCELSRGRKAPVKTFIMDSHVVVGVGNIYANEALFMAGIHPRRAAGRISLQRYRLLVDAIKKVLANAIAAGGTTLRDFTNSSGNPGYFKQSLFVYGRAGEPCKNCSTILKDLRLGGRSSVYCKQCQR